MGNLGLPALAIGSLGLPELVIILLIVVVVFGATKLPDLSEPIERFRAHPPRAQRFHLLLRRSSGQRWTASEWLLLLAPFVLVAVVIANFALRRLGRG